MSNEDFEQFEAATPRARKAPAKKAVPRKAVARKRVPADARQPQDYKPKAQTGAAARKAEADNDEFITISIRGIDIEIARDQSEWPLAALDHFSEGRHIAGVKALIDMDKWQELLDTGAKVKDMGAFADQLAEKLGVTDSGN